MSAPNKQKLPTPRPRPVQPPATTPPTETELARQRAADEGMTEAPPGTPAHDHRSSKTNLKN